MNFSRRKLTAPGPPAPERTKIFAWSRKCMNRHIDNWRATSPRSDAGRLGATTYAVPPIAIVLGWIFLDEVPALLAVIGGAISLIGVAIARRPAKHPAVVPPN
jgi:hypothetical protein